MSLTLGRTCDWLELARIELNRDLTSINFSENGDLLTTVAEDGSLRQWVLGDTELIRRACEHLSRNLTPFEWRRTFGSEAYSATCPRIEARH